MVSPRREVIPRSRKVLGCSGLILALGGLAFFWLPLVGVLVWALGLGISAVSLFVRGARAYGFSGVAVSLLCLGFTYVFLVMPWTPSEEKSSDAAARAAGTGAGVAAHNSNSQKTLADIFSSFGYRKKEDAAAGEPEKNVPADEPKADLPDAPEIEDAEDFSDEAEDAPTESEAEDSGAPAASAKTHARLPIAHFASISKARTTWPRSVRLIRSRTISLWDSEHKVIMGKMEIPAKSVVVVLDVKADASLLVLDRTGQVFNVLAADTDFAQAYAEKNEQ